MTAYERFQQGKKDSVADAEEANRRIRAQAVNEPQRIEEERVRKAKEDELYRIVLEKRRVREDKEETELKESISTLKSLLSEYDFLSGIEIDNDYFWMTRNLAVYRESIIDDKGYTKLCEWIKRHKFEIRQILPPSDTLDTLHDYNFGFTLNDVVLDIDDLCERLKNYIDPYLNYPKPKPKPAEPNWRDKFKSKSTIEEEKKEMYKKEMSDKRNWAEKRKFNEEVFEYDYSKEGGYTGYKSEEILSQLVDKYTKTFMESNPETDSNIVSQTIKTRMREFALLAIKKIGEYIIECFKLLCDLYEKSKIVSSHWDLTKPDRYKLIDNPESLPFVMRVMLTKNKLIKSEQAVTKGGSNRKKTKTIRKKTRTRKCNCNRSRKCRIRSRNSKKSYTI